MSSDAILVLAYMVLLFGGPLVSNLIHVFSQHLENKVRLQEEELEVRKLEAQARFQEHEKE